MFCSHIWQVATTLERGYRTVPSLQNVLVSNAAQSSLHFSYWNSCFTKHCLLSEQCHGRSLSCYSKNWRFFSVDPAPLGLQWEVNQEPLCTEMLTAVPALWRGGRRLEVERTGAEGIPIPKWYFPGEASMSPAKRVTAALSVLPLTFVLLPVGELSCCVVIYLFISELLGSRDVTVTVVTLVLSQVPNHGGPAWFKLN